MAAHVISYHIPTPARPGWFELVQGLDDVYSFLAGRATTEAELIKAQLAGRPVRTRLVSPPVPASAPNATGQCQATLSRL